MLSSLELVGQRHQQVADDRLAFEMLARRADLGAELRAPIPLTWSRSHAAPDHGAPVLFGQTAFGKQGVPTRWRAFSRAVWTWEAPHRGKVDAVGRIPRSAATMRPRPHLPGLQLAVARGPTASGRWRCSFRRARRARRRRGAHLVRRGCAFGALPTSSAAAVHLLSRGGGVHRACTTARLSGQAGVAAGRGGGAALRGGARFWGV